MPNYLGHTACSLPVAGSGVPLGRAARSRSGLADGLAEAVQRRQRASGAEAAGLGGGEVGRGRQDLSHRLRRPALLCRSALAPQRSARRPWPNWKRPAVWAPTPTCGSGWPKCIWRWADWSEAGEKRRPGPEPEFQVGGRLAGPRMCIASDGRPPHGQPLGEGNFDMRSWGCAARRGRSRPGRAHARPGPTVLLAGPGRSPPGCRVRSERPIGDRRNGCRLSQPGTAAAGLGDHAGPLGHLCGGRGTAATSSLLDRAGLHGPAGATTTPWRVSPRQYRRAVPRRNCSTVSARPNIATAAARRPSLRCSGPWPSIPIRNIPPASSCFTRFRWPSRAGPSCSGRDRTSSSLFPVPIRRLEAGNKTGRMSR